MQTPIYWLNIISKKYFKERKANITFVFISNITIYNVMSLVYTATLALHSASNLNCAE